MKLVFIHGRAQEKKVAASLQATWTDAFLQGLRNIGAIEPPGLEINFPYYGDLLFEETEKQVLADNAELKERGPQAQGPSAEEREFFESLVIPAAHLNGITDEEIQREAFGDLSERGVQNWPAVLAALRLLDRVPGVASGFVQLLTRDAWYYLTKKGLRGAVDRAVVSALPRDEACVVVAHSLGSVIAYNLLMSGAHTKVKKLITLGSPLGMEAIWKRLPSDHPPRQAPLGVSAWTNARDATDTVALYEIPAEKFAGAPQVVNYSGVENDSDNHHGIVEYLHDKRVAQEIYAALG